MADERRDDELPPDPQCTCRRGPTDSLMHDAGCPLRELDPRTSDPNVGGARALEGVLDGMCFTDGIKPGEIEHLIGELLAKGFRITSGSRGEPQSHRHYEAPILEPRRSRAEHIDSAHARGGGRMLEMINIALDYVEKAGGTVNMPCSEGTVEDMVSRVLRRATERGLLVEVRRTAKTVHISPPKAEPFAELRALAREHGVPALLDHLGLDDLGNEVNAALGAAKRCTCPVGFGQVAKPDCPVHGATAKHTIAGAENGETRVR